MEFDWLVVVYTDGSLQVLDSTAFADPEFIDTSVRKYESSTSESETDDSDGGRDDRQSACYDARITPLPHSDSNSDSQTSIADPQATRSHSYGTIDDQHRSYPLPPAARSSGQAPQPRTRRE